LGWADNHIKTLLAGDPVQFRPKGQSMAGKVESGGRVTVRRMGGAPRGGDVVLCKVRGRQYLHLVKAERQGMFKIGNNRGGINGWTPASAIYGLMVTQRREG